MRDELIFRSTYGLPGSFLQLQYVCLFSLVLLRFVAAFCQVEQSVNGCNIPLIVP